MALTSAQQKFVDDIAACVKKLAPQYGIRVHSPIIAQAILESGWGTSFLATKHNYFGIKLRSNETGAYVDKDTQEEYTPGQVTNITARFRVYPNMEEGVRGYFIFIQADWYANLKGVTDPFEYIRLIKEDGYATSSNYVKSLTDLINTYDLRKYDTEGSTTMANKLLVLPGHGNGDSGATGFGYQEQERVRALGNLLKILAPEVVELGDYSKNPYADNVIAGLNVSNDTYVIELHMDSASSASARGGHVIIKQGYSPDWFDSALASNISRMFPGRSNSIVGRNDLKDVNVAAQRGINYRLLECCFISNYDDLKKFNDDLNGVARTILEAFGVSFNPQPEPVPIPPVLNRVKTQPYADDDYQYWWMRTNPDGTVSFRNKGTWTWLSDPFSSKEQVEAQLWGGTGGDDGNKDPRDPQKFTIEELDNGAVKIHPQVAPNLSLDTAWNDPKDGALIQFHPNNESNAQHFILYQTVSGGTYRIVSTSGFKCIGAATA